MEKIMYECPNDCQKFSKSIGEIYEAGKRHKAQLVTCIEACGNQKAKISSLREDKNSLLDKLDELEQELSLKTKSIVTFSRENRDLMIELRNLRIESVEREEVIKEKVENNYEDGNLKLTIKDLEDEVLIKDHEISELNANLKKSKEMFENNLEQEINSVGKESKFLKSRVNILEAELLQTRESTLKRSLLFRHMDNLTDGRRTDIDNLKHKIQMLKERTFPACWRGTKCRRMFCKFDHSNLFKKDNRIVTENGWLPSENDTKEILCEDCGQLFQRTEKHEHNEFHDREEVIIIMNHSCRECNYVCDSRSELNAHVVINHNDESEIECEQCGKYFVSREELKDHRKTHDDDFNKEIISLNHRLQGLLGENSLSANTLPTYEQRASHFECKACDETFENEKDLRRHTQQKHKVHKEKSFAPKNIEGEHFQEEKAFECGMCVLDFTNGDQMNLHMDEKHEGRWKHDDPDVVMLGDDFEENYDDSESSISSSEDSDNFENESSEAQSGEDVV